ncbi:MAG: hypothetical protein H0T73_12880 [Ardenticatenales bacterium]|nr:hypothetical protein [Ardenticatenales bacterium]
MMEQPFSRDETQQQIIDSLATLRSRLRWRDGVRLAAQWGWLAVAAALGVQLLARVTPIAWAAWGSLALLLAALLLWLAWVQLRALPLPLVARYVDAEARTKERLATALELEAHARHDDLAMKQQSDAAGVAQRAARVPVETLPWQWSRRPVALAGVLLLATLIAPFLPNPMDAILAERAAVQREALEQAEEIENLREELAENGTLPREERERLLAEMDELAQSLRENPGDREEALADIERAREALRERQDPNSTSREASLEQLAAELQRMSGNEQAQER